MFSNYIKIDNVELEVNMILKLAITTLKDKIQNYAFNFLNFIAIVS